MAKNPGKDKRKVRQRLKARYSKKREEAQLAGVIPTTPEGAVRSEAVDPRTQDEQRFPGLDVAAIRADGDTWRVPAEVKRKVIEVNAKELFRAPERVKLQDGREVELIDKKAQQAASRVLMEADARQWERDNPEEAGKAKGSVNVGVGVAVSTGDLIRQVLTGVEAQKNFGKELSDGPQSNDGQRPSQQDDPGLRVSGTEGKAAKE